MVGGDPEPSRVGPIVLRYVSVAPLLLEVGFGLRVVAHHPKLASIFDVVLASLVEEVGLVASCRPPVH